MLLCCPLGIVILVVDDLSPSLADVYTFIFFFHSGSVYPQFYELSTLFAGLVNRFSPLPTLFGAAP